MTGILEAVLIEENSDELIEITTAAAQEDDDMRVLPEKENEPRGRGLEVKTETETEEALKAAPDEPGEDDFSKELAEMEQETEEQEVVEAIGDSITEQMANELETERLIFSDTPLREGPVHIFDEEEEDGDDDGDGSQDGPKDGDGEPPADDERPWYLKIPIWCYAVAAVLVVLIIAGCWIGFTKSGHGFLIKVGSRYVANQVNYAPVEEVAKTDIPDTPEDNPTPGITVIDDETDPVVTPDPVTLAPEQEEAQEIEGTDLNRTVNILLLGEESIGSEGYRGRTDLIMVATINPSQGSVKLTSIMRDCLVAIPGYKDNRVNAAYAIGGVQLLYDTLKLNLGLEFDNYVLVNFDSFENIIDQLGGVDVTLTKAEAAYLNKNNYITLVENRNVKEGLNHLNGDQALGYCRIRHVGTASHQYMDFGRTERQRALLSSLYSSFASLNYVELMSALNNCLPYLTTDITAEQMELYLGAIYNIGFDTQPELYRIPVDGSYEDAYVRDMLMTKINLQTNSEALRRYIYGVGQ